MSHVRAAIVAMVVFAALTSQEAEAQVTPRSPSISGPTFSPYLGLLRDDGGALPNYFTFVRPRVQLEARLRQQQRAINRGRQNILAVDRRLDTLQQQGGPRPTGVSAGFMRFSHFYPTLNVRR